MNYRTEHDVKQNLIAAGCDQQIIDACMDSYRAGNEKELVRLLRLHRRSLLDEIHAGERKIDCLDYLVYQLEKQV